MCLTVYGTQSLDDLEAMVSGKFAAVPNSNLQPPSIAGNIAVTMHSLSGSLHYSLKNIAQVWLIRPFILQ